MPQSCLWSFTPTSYFSNVLCLCAGPIHVNDTMVSFLSIDASTLCILFLSALFESVYFIFLDLKVATRTRSLRWCCSYASANKTWRDSCLHIKNTQTRKTHIHTIPLCLLHLVPSSKSKLRFRSSASTSSGPVRGFFLTFFARLVRLHVHVPSRLLLLFLVSHISNVTEDVGSLSRVTPRQSDQGLYTSNII